MRDIGPAVWLMVTSLLVILSGNGCSGKATSQQALRRLEIIEEFKRKVLKQLGYPETPRVSTLNLTAEERREMIQMYANTRLRPVPSAGTTRTFLPEHEESGTAAGALARLTDMSNYQTFNVSTLNITRSHGSSYRTTFAFNSYQLQMLKNSPTEKTKARLRLCTRIFHKDAILQRWRHPIKIAIIHGSDTQSREDHKQKVISVQTVNFFDSKWIVFDVTPALKQHLHPVLTLEIRAFATSEGDISHLRPWRTSVPADLLPTLSVTVASGTKERETRRKRQAEKADCVRGDGEKRCCRFHLYISFKEISWDDWVIAPGGYDAYYCSGDCPHRFKMAHTFSGIKSMLHLANPSRMPGPTCTATSLSPLTLLHLDENGKMAYTDYPDMIVNGCECS